MGKWIGAGEGEWRSRGNGGRIERMGKDGDTERGSSNGAGRGG